MNYKIPKKWCLILGNESHGISKSIQKHITNTVSIPGFTNIESLNVSIAGGILMNILTLKKTVTKWQKQEFALNLNNCLHSNLN